MTSLFTRSNLVLLSWHLVMATTFGNTSTHQEGYRLHGDRDSIVLPHRDSRALAPCLVIPSTKGGNDKYSALSVKNTHRAKGVHFSRLSKLTDRKD